MRVDDPGELLVAALERDHVHDLGDHVAGTVADDVGADDLAVLRVGDDLHHALAVVVDGRCADSAELEAADLDVVTGFLGRRLGQADRGDLRVAEGGAGDEVNVDGVGRRVRDRLDRDDALLGGLVGERGAAHEVADREDLLVGGALELRRS